jgi:hypothetical protein
VAPGGLTASERRRRPNGGGSVFQRSDGRWAVQFSERDALGYGKRRTLYAKSEEEAWRKLDEVLPEHKRGVRVLRQERSGKPFDERNEHVYLLQCEHGGPIKIGVADSVGARMSSIQACCPYPLRLLMVIENGGRDVERRLHSKLRALGLHLHHEWFADDPRVLRLAERLMSDSRVTATPADTG